MVLRHFRHHACFGAFFCGRCTATALPWQRTATTVVLVSGGYPGPYEKGLIIKGLDRVEDCYVFHAGTKRKKKHLVTNGGRVLALTALSKNMKKALKKAKENAKRIQFEGKYYRKDIGFDLHDKGESN